MTKEKKLQNLQNKSYSIGLDIGTSSVGWAVIDDDFDIIKKGNKQKSLWGVRLFDEAETAVARRGFRSIRRRYDRRRERINLLQEIFKGEIDKVDNTFYQKMKESFFVEEDELNKTIKLSDEEKISIKKYYEKYPTIYHLRNELITSHDKMDIRLVYLAIHHIIKYRGNFNHNISNFDINNINIKEKLESVFESIFENCEDIYSMDNISIENIDINAIEDSLNLESKTDRKKKLEKELMNYFHKKVSKELANALVGYEVNLENLFAIKLEENKKINLDASDFDENIEKIEKELDNKIEVLISLKDVFDNISLKNIFHNSKTCSISKLMVDHYCQHKKDLKNLKELVRANRVIFKKIFKNTLDNKDKEDICLYEKYIKNKLSYNDFVKEVKNMLEVVKNSENSSTIDDILDRIDKGSFLPRITDSSNGMYPYQLNEAELKTIIENQGKYYPLLLEKIDDEYKIVKLLKFKIPYYVGPLVSKNDSKFAWMIRKTDDKITPYNFDMVVDTRKSAKKFIYRMIGHCTYLLDKKQIPANSILYSQFKILNELKQIKINDKSIDNKLQRKIYNEFVLKTEGSLTETKFKEYLKTLDDMKMYDSIDVRGYSADKKFANNMQSYIDFFGNDGIFKGTALNIPDAEKIIELVTVLEDKDVLKEEVLELYPELQDKIGNILKLKYKGWSGLSRELLETKYYVDQETGIKKSIMDLMYETKENFMQIINNEKYNFQKMIDEYNQKEDYKLDYSLVENLATSPANKRGIYEALKVLNEIVDYMGYEPKYVSIEMARSNDIKKRTEERRKKLLKIYDDNRSSIRNYNEIKNSLNGLKDNSLLANNEKLYLYFLQEGKSLYSMADLDINHLDQYEVDHILPRAIIKDDSIDNKALVLKGENQYKKAELILPQAFRSNQNKAWWKHLNEIGLISRRKYNNLIRERFNDKDIEGFINRQLVETRQITKHIGNIVNNLYEDTKVIYLKANVSSSYRDKFELYKYRDLNDNHHAHDAYLAIVLGIYQTKYLKNKINKFELQNLIDRMIKEKRYDELRYGYLVNSIDQTFMKVNNETGEVFNVSDFTKKIENAMYRNDILVSKKTEIKTGEFYKQTIYKHDSKEAKIRIKSNLPVEIYGGYTSYTYSYMMLVKYQVKNKEEKALIGIPYQLTVMANNEEIIEDYIEENLGCDSYEILKDKIPFNIEIEYSNQRCVITGCATKSAEVINNKQFYLTKNEQIKYRDLLNYIFNKKYPKVKYIENEDKKTIVCDNKKFENYRLFKEYCQEKFNKEINDFFDMLINEKIPKYTLYSFELAKLRDVKNSGEFYNLKLVLTEEEKKELKVMSKIEVILEIFRLLGCNSQNANLELLNKTAKFNSRVGRKSKMNIKSGTFIYKSVTGLKEYHYEF